MNEWLLLTYKVPRHPTSTRVYVWRKLKQLGAILMHGSAWILPSNARTQEQLQWLVDEIRQLHGEATLWNGHSLMGQPADSLIEQFQQQTEAAYQEILVALKRRKPDLVELTKRYRQVQARDYFPGPVSQQTQEALSAAQGRRAT